MSEENAKSLIEELAELSNNTEEVTAESQPETTEEVPAPSSEEPKAEVEPENPTAKQEVPFHKHPRWLRLQQELAEAREEARMAKEAAEQRAETKTATTVESVPPEFQYLFGEDVQAFKVWESTLDGKITQKAQEILERQQRAQTETQEREAKAKQQAVSWAEEQFQELADESGVDFTDQASTERNQVLDIILKYGLFDQSGRPKVKEANELRQALYAKDDKTEIDERKKIAAKTVAKTNVIPKEDSVFTSSKLRKMDINQFFN